MDLTKLCNSVQCDGTDIVSEVMFQDVFGVSPSDELPLPKTDRAVARRILEHSNLCVSLWQTREGEHFTCNQFYLNGTRHRLMVVIFNYHQPHRFRVSLMCHPFMKYNKYGDNLVHLLYEMLKQEL